MIVQCELIVPTILVVLNVNVKMDILVMEDPVPIIMNALTELVDVISMLSVLITMVVFDVSVELDSSVMVSCVKISMNVLRVCHRVVQWHHVLKNEVDFNVYVVMSRISILSHNKQGRKLLPLGGACEI